MRGQAKREHITRGEPDIAAVAALIAEPVRARMLMALMGGQALTATELALEGNVAPSTASAHLAVLSDSSFLTVVRQGRHRYFRLIDPRMAVVLEQLMGMAGDPTRQRGPRDPALRKARVCFDHLAGELAVRLLEGFRRDDMLVGLEPSTVSPKGKLFFRGLGLDVDALSQGRRPLVRECLDWSERRMHLGGALGAAFLERLFALGWALREPGGRTVTVTVAGERSLRRLLEQSPNQRSRTSFAHGSTETAQGATRDTPRGSRAARSR